MYILGEKMLPRSKSTMLFTLTVFNSDLMAERAVAEKCDPTKVGHD